MSEHPPCRCGHDHESHLHQHRRTYCSDQSCDCATYRKPWHSRRLVDMLATAHRAARALRDELRQSRADLAVSQEREQDTARALRNAVALAPYCAAHLDLRPPRHRIPAQRGAA